VQPRHRQLRAAAVGALEDGKVRSAAALTDLAGAIVPAVVPAKITLARARAAMLGVNGSSAFKMTVP